MSEHLMQNHGGPHNPSSELPTALQLVTALTEEQHQQLRAFAAKRLQRLACTPGRQRLLGIYLPDDLVNQAIQKVLSGGQHPKKGRTLSNRNRVSTTALMDCLRGIINSDLSHLINSDEARHEHLPLSHAGYESGEEQSGPHEMSKDRDPSTALEQADLKGVLFERLRKAAWGKPELWPIIDHWENQFLEDQHIALHEFDRRQVWQVRRLAREILAGLAREVEPTAPTGMEMLL